MTRKTEKLCEALNIIGEFRKREEKKCRKGEAISLSTEKKNFGYSSPSPEQFEQKINTKVWSKDEQQLWKMAKENLDIGRIQGYNKALEDVQNKMCKDCFEYCKNVENAKRFKDCRRMCSEYQNVEQLKK